MVQVPPGSYSAEHITKDGMLVIINQLLICTCNILLLLVKQIGTDTYMLC